MVREASHGTLLSRPQQPRPFLLVLLSGWVVWNSKFPDPHTPFPYSQPESPALYLPKPSKSALISEGPMRVFVLMREYQPELKKGALPDDLEVYLPAFNFGNNWTKEELEAQRV